MRRTFFTATLSLALLLAACRSGKNAPAGDGRTPTPAATAGVENGTKEGDKMTIKLTSTAFDEGGMIPSQYTCDGQNVSPPLAWSDLPEGTKTLALICDDPDAPRGTWVHWVVYQIPASERGLPENLPARETLDGGARQGTNDFKKPGYGGPCPPSGTHRYFFKLYALDASLDLASGATKDQLLKATEGHVLAHGQLIGRYARQR
ncbi:MAG: YbhB/YbcL family Raf kinase inhibitor-like protein [Acidobacteriota bacterium]|nr:YbhB/YbcL family Raf kinase inhibitor-like protein [Acidobacteriota bacterium]MDQ5837185.1 YbhB/YbcL family Raf kinase inhibitor-like protein [Acidobacteriota bacterium]